VTWTDIAIAPIGALYFGDGRPTSAGETDHGAGRFPPSPRTIQGVLRTALLRSVPGLDLGSGADGARIADLVGPPEALPEGWRIAGPWLACWREDDDEAWAGTAREVKPWLPLPLFLRPGKGREAPQTGRVIALRQDAQGSPAMAWDVTETQWAYLPPSGAGGRGKDANAHVGPAGLRALLAGGTPAAADVVPTWPAFVRHETRVGIAVAPGREVAEEAMLYSLDYRRMADRSGFVARFRGDLSPEMDPGALTRGVALLGGRGRLARLLEVQSWCEPFAAALRGDHLPAEPADEARFWLWLTTPAPLATPSKPAFVQGAVDGARLRVLTAVVGPPQAIGGFDLVRSASHGATPCVPAGSAWLVEVAGGEAAARRQLIEGLHDAFPFELAAPDRALGPMGFGHTLLACLPAQESR
jgi:CRISPR type III-B/RAMP module-associated protein Cmr3